MYLTTEDETFLHRLHPVTKIVLLVVFFFVALLFENPIPLFIIMGMLFVLSVSCRLLVIIRGFLKLLLLLFFFSLIIWSFSGRDEDQTLLKFGLLTVKKKALIHGLSMGLRLDVMILAGLVFLATTRIEEFNAALMLMGLPYRVSFTIGLAFRLVPLLTEMAQTVIQAQKARGLDLNKGGLIKRVRNHFPVMVPVFILALRKVNNIAMALEVRGFGGATKASVYMDFSFGLPDILSLAVVLFIGIILLLV
ncbi:MAG: energy-coupling factor transporter transmembrane protein EcfT [Candidatus Tectomicrobia bacterium]|uniref:Energy-coupling factor transporter transmembrane protein EcfT n=1 Tax=Tectimicrobiota bacterium TaxID=2528274 RepID=A0A933GN38_UNCTE|nr:energy-coupling factor transporter transmembrane protein EcfT [Candidatus Tectomicrobia bacterium]